MFSLTYASPTYANVTLPTDCAKQNLFDMATVTHGYVLEDMLFISQVWPHLPLVGTTLSLAEQMSAFAVNASTCLLSLR